MINRHRKIGNRQVFALFVTILVMCAVTAMPKALAEQGGGGGGSGGGNSGIISSGSYSIKQ